MSNVKVLVNDQSVAYQGADGHHVHLEAHHEAAVPEAVAAELVFYGRARYLNRADLHKTVPNAPWAVATPEHIKHAAERRKHAASLARA